MRLSSSSITLKLVSRLILCPCWMWFNNRFIIVVVIYVYNMDRPDYDIPPTSITVLSSNNGTKKWALYAVPQEEPWHSGAPWTVKSLWTTELDSCFHTRIHQSSYNSFMLHELCSYSVVKWSENWRQLD